MSTSISSQFSTKQQSSSHLLSNDNMVRVISVHHFTSEEVNSSVSPNLIASAVASDLNVLVLALSENESPNVEVRRLNENNSELSHRFQTIDPVLSLTYSPRGQFFLFLESRQGPEASFIRAYMNWSDPAVQNAPCLPRIAGAVSPSSTSENETILDVIEFGSIKGCPPIVCNVCPSTGNVVVAHQPNLIVIYRFSLSASNVSSSHKKYMDFQEIIHIYQSFSPTELCLVEDVLGCISTTECHVFKIKIRETSDDERKQRSLSVYSFCSDSDFNNLETSDAKGQAQLPGLRMDSHNNITIKRQQDSETSQIGHLDGYLGNVVRHRNHRDIDDALSSKVVFQEVEEANKEYLSLGSPRIMDQMFGPFSESPEATSIKIVVNLDKSRLDSEFEADCLTLLRCTMFSSETKHEIFQNLKMAPVYWQKYKVKNKELALPSQTQFSHPLQSPFHSHLMSLTVCFTSLHEGYLYHVPGHLRKRGRGCGVQRIATYPFTAPVRKIALEPSLMHALTETGLETYTLRSGYYTVMEAENVSNSKVNACPGGDIPICLVGLRPFQGAKFLDLSFDRLVLISKDEDSTHTITNLKLPTHFDIYKDMIQLAELNKENSPHGCSQLLCEAHIVLRTWVHRLSWLLINSGDKKKEKIIEKLSETQALLNESCLKLANYHVSSQDERDWKLALPYYRLSGYSITSVIEEALKTRVSVDDPLPPGLLFYITEVLLHPTQDEKSLDSLLTDKIIDILGGMALDKLAFIVLKSSQFRSFKTKKMYDIFKKHLIETSDRCPNAEEVLAFALLCTDKCGGEESEARELIRSLSNVTLSEILIEHHGFLLDWSASTFSDLAFLIRDSVPEIFVEVLVSLIKDNIFKLGHILELFVGSFVSHDNNSTVVLQLFLETYFIEYLENPSSDDDSDIHQVLHTLIRSYLSCISTPIRFGDKNIDSDIFGPRDLYLEMLPPFQHGGSRETLLDAESPEFWCQNSLLKLQSLLCCPILVKDRGSYNQIVLDYLSIYPDTVGALSLKIICSDTSTAIQILSESHPEVLLTFCKERIRDDSDWRFLLETLQEHLSKEPNHPYHEGWYSSVQEILNHLAQTLSLDCFMSVLPSPMQGNEDVQGYIQMCRKIQQAQQLQDRISSTGQQLLSSLAL